MDRFDVAAPLPGSFGPRSHFLETQVMNVASLYMVIVNGRSSLGRLNSRDKPPILWIPIPVSNSIESDASQGSSSNYGSGSLSDRFTTSGFTSTFRNAS